MNLGSIVTAMVTPFDDRGDLDVREAQRVARFLVERGNDGLVVAGSTGEGMALNDHERSELFSAVKEAVGPTAAVWANIGTNETRGSVFAAQAAERLGVDALLAVVPYYNKPTQNGMIAHFGAIAQATRLPVIIYNIPGRTAANMLPDTLAELARRHTNIVGVKESSGDLKQIAMMLRDRAPGFAVYAGDDHLYLPCLAMGADGIVGVASHLCSREFVGIQRAVRDGRIGEAARIHASLLELFDALFATTSPIPVKFAMREFGFAVGECRQPLDLMSDELAERLRLILPRFR